MPFDSNELSVFIAALVVAVGLWVLLRHTPLGLRMRAVVDRADLAQTRGVNDRTTSRSAWVIGMMLAAIAGVVGAPIIGSLDSSAFVAIDIRCRGGRGPRRAAVDPVGVRSAGCSSASPRTWCSGTHDFAKDITGFNSAVPFVLLLVGLVVMARDRSRRGGSAADEVPPPDYLADLPLVAPRAALDPRGRVPDRATCWSSPTTSGWASSPPD